MVDNRKMRKLTSSSSRCEEEATRVSCLPQHEMVEYEEANALASNALTTIPLSTPIYFQSRSSIARSVDESTYINRSTYYHGSNKKKRKSSLFFINSTLDRLHNKNTSCFTSSHLLIILILSIACQSGYSFSSLSTKHRSFVTTNLPSSMTKINNRQKSILIRYASTKSSSKESIQAVQPLTSSSKEKRMSVQRAWEEQAQLLDIDGDNNVDSKSSIPSSSSSSISATPFLDLFTDAGIASVRTVQHSNNNSQSSSSSSSENSSKHLKPRGRPASVPGAMSRSTMMGINEMESRSNNNLNPNSNNMNTMERRRSKNNNRIDLYDDENDFINDSNIKSTISSSSSSSRLEIRKAIQQKSSTASTAAAKNLRKTSVKGRGRGRPRKDKGNDASIDEITSIAATSSTTQSTSDSNQSIDGKEYDDINLMQSMIASEGSDEIEKPIATKSRRGELTTLRPKARKLKESEKEGESTGMMQSGKAGKGGKDGEPPNLQRYYRTELLTPEEEYTLGMKIQFMIHCELVHDGLLLKLDRNPTIEEWAIACGFKEIDTNPISMNADYIEQIRPLKSETIDPVEDANMFVGNGLVNASGPGRGRGRSKKRPPTKLTDYYDDSDIRFENDYKVMEKKLKPINRGTTMDFVELMINAKEAKQRMVQCNMRLVVSISKRYKHVGVNIADLVQEGSIGLTRAAEKFDPKKGFKFSTYASWWIQQAVFRSIAYHSRTIRLPVHVHNLLNRTRRVRLELQRILGRAPTNEEMAGELDMSLEKYNKMIRLTRKAISLDMAKYQNNPKDIGQESETSLGDTIDATEVIRDENSPEQNVDQVLFRDDLKEMLEILGDDEKAVICARYGINDGLTRTVTTVAAQMGQSKSWVRSQECRALRKLRRPWYEKRLWEHQNSLTG